MNFTLEQRGILKGVLGTSIVSVAVAGIGLFFLHRKHEEELDKLQRDTARDCLDFAAEHYERVIRRLEKANAPAAASAEIPFEETEEFQQEIDAMNNHEDSPDTLADWDERIRRLRQEFDAVEEEFLEKRASLGVMEARWRARVEEDRFRALQAEADLVEEELRRKATEETG